MSTTSTSTLRSKLRKAAVTGIALAATVGMAGTAMAAHDDNPSAKVASYSYDLNPVQADTVPNSQATGTTRIKALPSGKVQVKVEATGLMPNVPHAMHLHGVDGPMPDNACPTGATADGNDDGFVDTLEGVPFYGGILASLTTSGDTTASLPLRWPASPWPTRTATCPTRAPSAVTARWPTPAPSRSSCTASTSTATASTTSRPAPAR